MFGFPNIFVIDTAPRDAAREIVDAQLGELVHLSHEIHAHPELSFEETRAAAWWSRLT